MNEREYLEYLKEQSYEAYKSYEYLDKIYADYTISVDYQNYLIQQERDSKIEEILK
jgi:hypothetical protein